MTQRPEAYTVNVSGKQNRMSTMVVLTPNGRHIFIGTRFDEPAWANPDGSAIPWSPACRTRTRRRAGQINRVERGGWTWSRRLSGSGRRVARDRQVLRRPRRLAVLHRLPQPLDTFVIGAAAGDGCVMGTTDDDGKVEIGPLVKVDTSAGMPSELCWLSGSPDDRFVYATNFGFSYLSTFKINGHGLEIARDPASPKVKGDGKFRALNNTVSSGPSDSWVTPDGAYLYQIFGNASKLVVFATHSDGSLDEVTSVPIPYNSPQGLAGF